MQTYKARNDSTKAPPSTRTTFVEMTENTGEENKTKRLCIKIGGL